MALSRRCDICPSSSLCELLNFESEDKLPRRISISNGSDRKGGGVIKDAAKSPNSKYNANCRFEIPSLFQV